MFRKTRSRAVIGDSGQRSALGKILMPNGEHALILDKSVYQSALSAADEKFIEVVKTLESGSARASKRKTAA